MAALAVGCSSPSKPPSPPPTSLARSVAASLAAADHAPHRVAAYSSALKALARRCGTPQAIAPVVEHGAAALGAAHLPQASRLDVLRELALATRSLHESCSKALTAYLTEVSGHRAPTTSSGWGGYAGSLTAFEAAHHAYPGRPGTFLPKLPNGDGSYEVYSGSPVTGLYRRFDPPVGQPTALAVVLRDLVPGAVHRVYLLHTPQCQQEIYLGSQLGQLTGDSSVGVFVELTSGQGVGRTRYDARAVNRARLTPGGAIGGQPCT